jgi:hypothetical protein
MNSGGRKAAFCFFFSEHQETAHAVKDSHTPTEKVVSRRDSRLVEPVPSREGNARVKEKLCPAS